MSDYRWQEESEEEQYEMIVKIVKKVGGYLSWSEQQFLCWMLGLNTSDCGLKDYTNQPYRKEDKETNF